MKKDYESPAMEVFSFDTPDVVMDVSCPYLECTADGVCVMDGQCITDNLCTPDMECVMDGQCVLDGASGL